jgi:ABC-2 type transport system permease protein
LKRSFLLVVLSVPAFIAFSVGVSWLIETVRESPKPVGIVDRAGIVPADPAAAERAQEIFAGEASLEFIPFASEQDARAGLESESIQAFVILPESYPDTRQVELVFIEEPGENVGEELETFLQANLVAGEDPETAARLVEGSAFTVRSADGQRELSGSGLPFDLIIPFFLSIAFLFLIMMSSGYMLDAVAEEKENRTLEILTTTIATQRLLAGKVIGIVLIGFTILLTWLIFLAIGALVASWLGVSWVQDISFDWRILLATVVIAIPAFVLVAAIMTGIGAMVTTSSEGQSVSALFFMLHLAPLYVVWAFASTPHSPVAVLLSLTPFTALLTLGMRHLFTVVPTWQIYASALIQLTLAIAAVGLAGRAFRLGRLQYGQRVSLRRLWKSPG